MAFILVVLPQFWIPVSGILYTDLDENLRMYTVYPEIMKHHISDLEPKMDQFFDKPEVSIIVTGIRKVSYRKAGFSLSESYLRFFMSQS